MEDSAYSVAAAVMRWFFLAALAYITVGAALRSAAEGRRLRALKRYAELDVRWIEILEPQRYAGKWFALDGESACTLGSSGGCDIALKQSELKDEHAIIYVRGGRTLFKTKQRRMCEVNGEKPPRHAALSDGDKVWIKDVCFVCHRRRTEDDHDGGEE